MTPDQVTTVYGRASRVEWKEISAERFDDMLGVLPPVAFGSGGFMVGEAWSHVLVEGREFAAYAGFKHIDAKFYECLAPLTVAQFKALTPADVLERVVKP